MIRKTVAALAMSGLALLTAPAANADNSCQFPVVVIAIAAPVTLVCGNGNIASTNQTVTVDPSLQVDPHLFAQAP